MQIGPVEVRRILVVEDEMLLAMNLEDMLVEMGHTVVGVATRISQAVAMAECSEIDLAILDLNLAGTLSFPVADVLRRRGIPFIFASGYGINGLADNYRAEIVLAKPYSASDLDTAISRLSSTSAV